MVSGLPEITGSRNPSGPPYPRLIRRIFGHLPYTSKYRSKQYIYNFDTDGSIRIALLSLRKKYDTDIMNARFMGKNIAWEGCLDHLKWAA